jgi:biopolymer transport protein ExbD
MSLKRTSKNSHHTMSELNITPLLDLVFVLLVIFIITTPQLVNNLEMTLPSGKPPTPSPNQPKPKINKIVVDDTGQTFLNDQPVTVAELKSGLETIKTYDTDPAVVVNGSDIVEYQKMVDVLGVLQQLEITKIGLVTR